MARKVGWLLAFVVAAFLTFVWLDGVARDHAGQSLPDLVRGVVATEAPKVPEIPAVVVPEELTALASEALDTLNDVPVTPTQRIPAYDRAEQFTPNGKGTSWPDVDGNSCDTRNDILARDLTDTVVDGGCTVLSGTLADPYTGKTIEFVRDVYQDGKKVGGNSSAVQIDHIVPLKLAWESGASQWTQDERVAFANDPQNLLASDGPANSSKGAQGPSTWMPSNAGNAAYDCTYAVKFTGLLAKYGLSATPADSQRLAQTLTTCH